MELIVRGLCGVEIAFHIASFAGKRNDVCGEISISFLFEIRLMRVSVIRGFFSMSTPIILVLGHIAMIEPTSE